MPGFELMGQEELQALQSIFTESGGCLFAHGFPAMRNGRFRVREFENELASKFGAKYALAVSSGTAAQFVALKALGVGRGDEVITQAFTFIATVEAIIECGATPVVVDVDETLNMCPKALKDAINSRTKAIIPVHMLGNVAKMNEINEIARARGVSVFEDACEALGATYNNKSTGTLADCGFFSLDFGKTITSGEGGFILTDSEPLYKKMAAYHDHGHINAPGVHRGQDVALCSGFNFRMTEMQAAVGSAQLKRLDFILGRNRVNKQKIKARLASELDGRITFRSITSPNGELADTLMFFVKTAESAKKIVQDLSANGVGTKNVPDAMNWHFAANWGHIWQNSDLYRGNFNSVWNKSAEMLNRCISLPIMVNWTDEQIISITNKVINAVKSHT